jgi:hypothetical protein
LGITSTEFVENALSRELARVQDSAAIQEKIERANMAEIWMD